jgi:precorrin isomerase
VPENMTDNLSYQKNVVTTGLSFFLTQGAVVKADLQFVKTGVTDKYATTFNAGFGVMF